MQSFLSSSLLSSQKEKLGENESGIGGFRKKKMGLAKSEVG
jgi:hypothetical protein